MSSLVQMLNRFVMNPKVRFGYLSRLGFYNNWSDEKYLKKEYFLYTGKQLDLENPKSFNEKIQWLKLYDRKPIYTTMVDKYATKEYVANLIGNEYIVPLLGVWNTPDEIDFESLPQQFVLKTTHDSGTVIICRDKDKLNIDEVKRRLWKSLRRNYYLVHREWPYKDVSRKIIAEQYLESEEGKGLRDYKFFNFNGKSMFVYISEGLENHSTARISFFDFNGEALPFNRLDYKPLDNCAFPSNFQNMKEISDLLARKLELPFVRTDFYSVNNKIYFSEITFSPCAGLMPLSPEKYDLELGKLIQLPDRVVEIRD